MVHLLLEYLWQLFRQLLFLLELGFEAGHSIWQFDRSVIVAVILHSNLFLLSHAQRLPVDHVLEVLQLRLFQLGLTFQIVLGLLDVLVCLSRIGDLFCFGVISGFSFLKRLNKLYWAAFRTL